jgi:hypothetical protein
MQRRWFLATTIAALALAGCSTTRQPSPLDPVRSGSLTIAAPKAVILDGIVSEVLPPTDIRVVHERSEAHVSINYTGAIRTVLSALPTRDMLSGADMITLTRVEFQLSGDNPVQVDWQALTVQDPGTPQERRFNFVGVDFRFIGARLETLKRNLEK